MAIYFHVDVNNNIVNSCEWDGVTPYEPPQGITLALSADGYWRDGWKWNGTAAYDPNPPPAMEPVAEPVASPGGLNKV